MNPWLLLAAAVALVGAYAAGRHDGAEIAEAAALREERVAALAADAAQKSAAKAIAGITVTNTTLRQTLEREVRENVVYRDCRHSADGLRILNAALAGRAYSAANSQLSGVVSAD